jgi:hypothetical protein
MAINKIKLKQIDADFSGLVGQYGSGYFATTGQLSSLSGISVKYSDLTSTQFVYQTGNQNISGNKVLFSRPTLSGTGILSNNQSGLAMLSEVVTRNGSETITGPKIFDAGGVTFTNSDVNFQFQNINFEGAVFTFDADSANDFASSFSNTFVNTTSNQVIGGLKNFTNGIRVNGTGVLLSGQSVGNISGSSISGASIFGNTLLVASGFSGVSVSGASIFGSNMLATSISGTSVSGASIFGNTIRTTSISGTSVSGAFVVANSFSGSALNANSSTNLNIGTLLATDNINFQFPAGTTAYQLTNTFFAPNSDSTRALGQASPRRWSIVYAGTATINTSDLNLKTEISEIPDAWLDAWQEVNYTRYKFKDAVAQKGISGARWHIGLIAQDIHEKFQSHGLDAFEIGMLCYDKWDSYTDPDGKIIPSGEIWSIRPDECQFMEMALTRRSLNRLKSGISI